MATSRVPGTLPVVAQLGRHASGRAWLARLPGLIEELRTAWGLRLGAPFHGGSCSWVAPAWRKAESAAEPLVLKVTWPHREAAGEAEALRLWDGRGAVRIVAHDAERTALLLERCVPGTDLWAADGLSVRERLARGAGVLAELAAVPVPAGCGLEPVGTVTAEWADLLEERAARLLAPGADAGVCALGARLLRELPGSAARSVVVHGDANPGNVLAAGRRPWLAIDAKPMVGDPDYDPWPLVGQVGEPFTAPDPRAVLRDRFALVADLTGGDAARAAAWAAARQAEGALWGAAHGEQPPVVAEELRRARVLADVAGA